MNNARQTQQAEELLRRCFEAENAGDIATLQTTAQEALQLAQINDDPYLAANGAFYLGRAALRRGSLPEAREQFEKARALNRKANARQVEANALRSLGIVYLYQGEASQSMTAFEEAAALHRAIGDQRGECFALNNMGSVAMQQGNLERARDLFAESFGPGYRTPAGAG